MGTLWTITVFAGGEEIASQALDASFEKLDALNLVMSDYLATSEVRQITTEWAPASVSLAAVLRESITVAEKTSGNFDPAVGTLTKLWRRAFRKQKLPSQSAIDDALETSGYRNLLLEGEGANSRVRITKPGVKIDFGGIGKGYAMAELGALLVDEFDISIFLIDGGGDVFAGGAPPGASGWSVEVRGNGAAFVVSVADVAVMTSGDLYKFAEIGGMRYSHLIDPKSGLALEDSASATVIMEDPARADALASALCVSRSRTEGERYLSALAPDCAVRVSAAGKTLWEVGLEPFKTAAAPLPEEGR